MFKNKVDTYLRRAGYTYLRRAGYTYLRRAGYTYLRRVGYTQMIIVGLSISQWLPWPLAIWAFALDGNLVKQVGVVF